MWSDFITVLDALLISALLENMVPSDAETPSRNYIVRGEMGLRSGHRYQYFVTPWLDGWSNASVPVQAGLTTDLGQTFVMDPGFVTGAVNLFGPPQGDYLSKLRHDADYDYDGNGLPDNLNLTSTNVQTNGTSTLAQGATFTARGGQARVGFVANYQAESASIKGDYQMVLGGLNGEASVWDPSY